MRDIPEGVDDSDTINISTGKDITSLDYKLYNSYGNTVDDDLEMSAEFGPWNGDDISITINSGYASGDYTLRISDENDENNYIDVKINIYNLIDTVILSKYSYTYDGKVHKPAVTVYDSNYNKVSSADYTVTYGTGCKAVGYYYVTVKSKTDDTDWNSAEFSVMPKGTALTSVKAGDKSMTVKWKKQTLGTSGYIVEYSRYKDFRSFKTKKVAGSSKTSVTIGSLGYGNKYYVRVKTYKASGGVAYDSSPSAAKTVTTPVLSQAKAKSKITGPLYRAVKKNVSNPSKVKIVKAWVGKSDSSVFTDYARINVIVFKYTYYGSTYYAIGWIHTDSATFDYVTNWSGNEYYLTNRSKYSIKSYL